MFSINVPGQIAIKSAHGRFGQFNIGCLSSPLGDFIVKDAQLDIYDQGKYDGEFDIERIFLKVSAFGGRIFGEVRAVVSKMTLSSINSLSQDEAQRLTPHEVDPVEEQVASPPESTTTLPAAAPVIALSKVQKLDPLKDPTPFGMEVPASPESAQLLSDPSEADRHLFGLLYPLANVIKLDATVDRLLLRQQRDRLKQLGYVPDPLTQSFRLAA